MQTKEISVGRVLGLRVGELVEVRSEAEILATLDKNGELDSLPFMPEMLQYCGQQFTVYKVAHKLCDTQTKTGMRKMQHAVHLSGVRCDGQAHGGCQTACLIYWKEAWLKRVNAAGDPEPDVLLDPGTPRMTRPLLQITTRKDPAPDGAERFSCQATELLRAAPEPLPFRDLGQYMQDVRSGNVGVLAVLRAFFVGLFNRLQGLSTRMLPRRLWFREGLRWGFVKGTAAKTPTGHTDLQPGELVRIKSKEEIMKTLNKDLLNRGMGFEEEMSRYCGREARVLRRVDRCIDERTGRLLHMKNPCIVLADTICTGAYNANCPRSIYPFWREIWLERVTEPNS
ncbi:MAG TPA: hypothetical protein VFQ77_03130 [Pseudonocardiaceae bacterium]|jgi:hypothetical protein|nr:hypothetical protein [Pseudonocardiaceae bacterium]